MQVALYRPEIPQNTGNIGRLCVGFGASLVLLGDLGFEINNRRLKRAGLDYWQHLDYAHYADIESWMEKERGKEIVCISKYGSQMIYDYPFDPETILLFGRETTGVPAQFLEKYGIKRVRIPIIGEIRSYNLANSAAICLSEAWRQINSQPL